MNHYIIAADIGGSHISSTIINTKNWQIDPAKIIETKVDTFSDKQAIIQGWIQNLQQTAHEGNIRETYQIAIALPGPFDYQKGIFQAHPEGKMGALVGENFRDLLLSHFGKNLKITFENDAACFGLGEACFGVGKPYERIMGITLGTGIGSSFVRKQKIVKNHQNLPSGGELYAESYAQSMADDYFSTRWFVQQTYQDLGLKVSGVRELLVQAPESYSQDLFKKFATHFYQFLLPYAKNFETEVIVIGGNIAKAWQYFGEELTSLLKKENIIVQPSLLNERAIMLGAAKVFSSRPIYWAD